MNDDIKKAMQAVDTAFEQEVVEGENIPEITQCDTAWRFINDQRQQNEAIADRTARIEQQLLDSLRDCRIQHEDAKLALQGLAAMEYELTRPR